ncbi:MAG: DUF3267 domain-containing protein [Scytonema sp. PMC 1069.18]|nr:DUF3267 domain-containing protein [Scytonema sp. PMC 1069.18]MEC4885555.1 DUF3267 domain-containing protein [Scytonema sp. PMC 1070.18]
MTTINRAEPAYIFRVSPDLTLRWTGLSILLFFISVAGVSAYYQAIHNRPWSLGTQTNYNGAFSGFLLFVTVLIGTLFFHELVHGLAFTAFGGSPRYGVGIKYFLAYAYATSPGTLFSRNAFVVISLAPLVVIDIMCLFLLALFPQAMWLGWLVIINTCGAIGDIWMAILLLRCPASIQVEDHRSGMAIYTPPNVDVRSLPFKTPTHKARSALWVWVSTTLLFLIVVPISSLLLTIIFDVLRVPSFILGTEDFWILRWQNNDQGFGIVFHLPSILAIAATIGLVGILLKVLHTKKNHHRPNN